MERGRRLLVRRVVRSMLYVFVIILLSFSPPFLSSFELFGFFFGVEVVLWKEGMNALTCFFFRLLQ